MIAEDQIAKDLWNNLSIASTSGVYRKSEAMTLLNFHFSFTLRSPCHASIVNGSWAEEIAKSMM
jgi:hypothetical protein